MAQQVYSLSISARAVLNLHSLNNEGGEGNQIQTRMVDIVYTDSEGNPHQANVNAISGDTLKHIQAEHLHHLALAGNIDLCAACQRFDANRMSADPEFRKWLESKPKPTQVQVVDRLIANCVIDDLEGNLITESGFSAPRKSVAEFGWAIGIPDAVVTDEYFHVKYVPDRRQRPEDKDEREGNLGQALFHRPASSGVYALVCNFELARIGYNDISQTYVSGVDRLDRYKAMLKSILYTLIQMNGAMRTTQLPHLVDLDGVIAVSNGVVPAPTVSPLNKCFVSEIQKTSEILNSLQEEEVVRVSHFQNLSQFSELMGELIQDTSPYTIQAGT